MQRTALILAYLFICTISLAQQYPFVHYTPREGLVNNRARFIFQDSKGKLYISTFAGLSVYDGSRFVNYNTRNGLSTDLVNDIIEMGEDSLWIFPNSNKINCLVKGRLKDFVPSDNFVPLINEFIKCSDGNYYAMADEGLFVLSNDKFIKIPFDGIPADEAVTLLNAVEIDNKLFITSNPHYQFLNSNLIVYDLVQKKVLDHNKDLRVIYLFKTSADELWFSTEKGMYRLNNGDQQKPAFEPLPDSFHMPKDLYAHYLYEDKQKNIWAASTKGVHRIKKNGQVKLFSVANGLTTEFQSSIFQDKENNIWFTNEQTGLSKLSNQQLAHYAEFIPGHTTTDIFIHPTSDSVFLYDGIHRKLLLHLLNGRNYEFFHNDIGSVYAKFVSARENYLIIGTRIFRWQLRPGDKEYSLPLLLRDSLAHGFTTGLRDKNGHLVAVSNKLTLVDENEIIQDSVLYLADQFTIDQENRAWVAPRSNRLFCFTISSSGNKKSITLTRTYDNILPGSSPRSIVADKNGNIWIGARDWGLYRFQFDSNLNIISRQQLTTQNGLSENFVSYLYCDHENNIWACTPSGLDRIRVDKNNFLVENITRSINFYLPISKVQQTASGMYWILTSAGIITYTPDKTLNSDWQPILAFSDVLINNSNLALLPANNELKHYQNNLAFHLSAPTFIDEKQTRFSYLLEGSGNENWTLPSTDASVNLVNLPPGDYVLKAKAIFLHGRYPDAVSTFSFTILPPWWLTWWFKTLVGVVILVVFLLGLRFYINRKLALQRAMLEKKQAIEKERTRIATDMHDDLGAGLSQIKFLSEAIGMKRQKHLSIEEEVSSIRSFSDEMIDKMGEIVWALNEKNDTLSDLLSYTRSYAVEYLAQNGISCQVEEPDNIPQDYVSGEFRRNIYLTVKEALHNIVKHAQATDVLVKIEINSHLTIQIADNGIGLNNSSASRWGNGLISMKNRINELNGTFDIKNRDGTIINIRVPLVQ